MDRDKKNRRNKLWKYRKANGIPASDVPAEPYRQMILRLGLNAGDVERATGGAVSKPAARQLILGELVNVRRSTALALDRADLPSGVLKVPRIGVQRRLEALMWMQWPGTYLKGRLGAHPYDIRRFAPLPIEREMAEKVSVVYDELSMKLGPSVKTRTYAIKHGFSPPLAWEENTIDDPDAVPYSGTDAGKYDWESELEFLLSCGVSEEQALKQLGRTRGALAKRKERAA